MKPLWKTIGWVWRFTGPRQVEEALRMCNCSSYYLHATFLKQGLLSFTTIANTLLSFYFRHSQCVTALRIFHSMAPWCKDSVSWNIVIHGFLHLGDTEQGLDYFNQARRFPTFEPNVSTLVIVLQSWSELGDKDGGEQCHAYLIKACFLSVLSIQNSLLRFYTGSGHCLEKLFDEMPLKDVVSCSLVMSSYVKRGKPSNALVVFREMVSQGIELDGIVMASALNACAKSPHLNAGISMHGLAIRLGLVNDLYVTNSLIDAYSKSGSSLSAFMIFSSMLERNQVTWNSMLSGFIYNENFYEAIKLILRMIEEKELIDDVTVVNILKLSKHFGHPHWTRMIHGRVVRSNCECNHLIMNSLIDTYANCDLMDQAYEVFVRMKRKDVVLWSTLIHGFGHNYRTDEAIAVFKEMTTMETAPNSVTITNVMEACAASAELKKAKWSHGIAVRHGFDLDLTVGTSIVNMYAKCGEIELSKKVFAQIPNKNVVTWSAMISACATHGLAKEALSLLGRMKQQEHKPNAVTFLSVLTACSHGGLVTEGLNLLESMQRYWKVKPQKEHYSCVVDMLGRSGMLSLASELMECLHKYKGVHGDANALAAFLSACRNYMNGHRVDEATSRILAMKPLDSSGYVLGSSIYYSHGSFAEAANLRLLARERGVKFGTGYSLVHLSGKVHRFVAGAMSGEENSCIIDMVRQLHAHTFLHPSGNLFHL